MVVVGAPSPILIWRSTARRIKLLDELREPVRDPLPYNVVVHGAQLVPNPGLDLRSETSFAGGRAFAGLRLEIFHDLFHVSPS